MFLFIYKTKKINEYIRNIYNYKENNLIFKILIKNEKFYG